MKKMPLFYHEANFSWYNSRKAAIILFLWPDDTQALPAPVPMANYTIPLSLHGIILLPEEWRLNAMYMKKNMTLLRCPIEKGLDMLGGK